MCAWLTSAWRLLFYLDKTTLLSRTGTFFATGSEDGTVVLWSMNTLSAMKLFNCADGISWDPNTPTNMSPFSIHYILVLCEVSLPVYGTYSQCLLWLWIMSVTRWRISCDRVLCPSRDICWQQREMDSKALTSSRTKVQMCFGPTVTHRVKLSKWRIVWIVFSRHM